MNEILVPGPNMIELCGMSTVELRTELARGLTLTADTLMRPGINLGRA